MNLSPFHFAGLRHIHSPVNPSVLYTTVARQPPPSPAPAPLLSMSPHSSYPRVPSSFLPLQAPPREMFTLRPQTWINDGCCRHLSSDGTKISTQQEQNAGRAACPPWLQQGRALWH